MAGNREPKIYRVQIKQADGTIATRLVRGSNPQQVVAWCARDTICASLAKQQELLGKNPSDVSDATRMTINMETQMGLPGVAG